MCPSCGRSHKRGKNNRCPNCYQKAYRKNPLNRRKHCEAVKRYVARNPEKYKRWSWTWELKTGRLIPSDVHQLRWACKFLEACVAAAEVGQRVRFPSKRRCDAALKREDRLRMCPVLLSTGANSSSNYYSGDSTGKVRSA